MHTFPSRPYLFSTPPTTPPQAPCKILLFPSSSSTDLSHSLSSISSFKQSPGSPTYRQYISAVHIGSVTESLVHLQSFHSHPRIVTGFTSTSTPRSLRRILQTTRLKTSLIPALQLRFICISLSNRIHISNHNFKYCSGAHIHSYTTRPSFRILKRLRHRRLLLTRLAICFYQKASA